MEWFQRLKQSSFNIFQLSILDHFKIKVESEGEDFIKFAITYHDETIMIVHMYPSTEVHEWLVNLDLTGYTYNPAVLSDEETEQLFKMLEPVFLHVQDDIITNCTSQFSTGIKKSYGCYVKLINPFPCSENTENEIDLTEKNFFSLLYFLNHGEFVWTTHGSFRPIKNPTEYLEKNLSLNKLVETTPIDYLVEGDQKISVAYGLRILFEKIKKNRFNVSDKDQYAFYYLASNINNLNAKIMKLAGDYVFFLEKKELLKRKISSPVIKKMPSSKYQKMSPETREARKQENKLKRNSRRNERNKELRKKLRDERKGVSSSSSSTAKKVRRIDTTLSPFTAEQESRLMWGEALKEDRTIQVMNDEQKLPLPGDKDNIWEYITKDPVTNQLVANYVFTVKKK
jgi:hypothetical protein